MVEGNNDLESAWIKIEQVKVPKPINLKIILVVAIAIILVLASFLYIYTTHIGVSRDDWNHLSLSQEKIDDGWIITVNSAHLAWSDIDGFDYMNITYGFYLGNFSNPIDNIDGNWDETGTIIFFDNDNNNRVSINDTFKVQNNTAFINQYGPQPYLCFGTAYGSFLGGIRLE